MPRKARNRFARLARDLRASNGQPTPGSDAFKYFEFVSGARKLKQDNKTPAGGKRRGLVTVLPFNKETGTVRYGAHITQQAFKNQVAMGATDALTGQGKYTGDGKTDTYDPSFNAAIITWRGVVGESNIAPVDAKKSAITDKVYKYAGGRSGTSPFGKTATNPTEDGAAKALQASILAIKTNLGATYQPEEWNNPYNPKDAASLFGA